MEINQRTAGVDGGGDYFAENDPVIAGFEDAGFTAFDGGERAGEEGRGGNAGGPIDIVEALIGFEREGFR